jgi:hypothetical protein
MVKLTERQEIAYRWGILMMMIGGEADIERAKDHAACGPSKAW